MRSIASLIVCGMLISGTTTALGQDDELEDLKRRVKVLEESEKERLGSFWTKAGSMFELYGFLRLDMMYDDSEVSDNQVIAFVLSEDPATGQQENDDSFTMTPRLTRLGLNFDGPELGDTDWDLTGKLEIDFYAFPASDSRNLIRMRKAYLQVSTEDWFVLAGQTSDLFSPLYPSVNADLVMWNAGNTGDRRPQLRFGLTPESGDTKFSFTTALGLTGAIDGKNDTIDGVTNGEDSGLPQIALRAGADTPVWNGQRLKIGAWYVRAWEETDTRIAGTNDFDTHLLGVDAWIPFSQNCWLQGEAWVGENMSDLRGGAGQGINLTTGDEIKGHGGFVELGFKPVSWETFYIGYALDNPKHNDLPFGARDHNQTFYVATKCTYLDPIVIGMEYLHWETEYVGLNEGDANRVKLYVQYNF